MNLTETEIVKPDDVRPARPDGTCFYCSAPLGGKHKSGCVILSRSVVVRVMVDVVIDVPQDWDKEAIEFARNESSWCADNILRDIGEWTENKPDDVQCACPAVEITYLRDATAEDHEELPVLIAPVKPETAERK